MKTFLKFDNLNSFAEYAVDDDKDVTIGRETDNRVSLALDVLSRHHARLFVEGGKWFVEDLDSANGSFYRGNKLAPNAKTELQNGDVVRFGTVAMSIRWDVPAPAAAPAPGGEKVVEKIVEKIVEVPVSAKAPLGGKVVKLPDAWKSPNAVPPGSEGEAEAKPFRPGLVMPEDMKIVPTTRVFRI